MHHHANGIAINELVEICRDFVTTMDATTVDRMEATASGEQYLAAAAAEIARCAIDYMHLHQADYGDAKTELPA